MQANDLTLRIAARDILALDVVCLVLAAPDGAPLPEWLPGAHIDIEVADGLVRQYSLCGDPSDRFSYRIAVLREPEGRGGSRRIHDELRVGDALRVGGPRNNFDLVPSPRYIFIAGGIGVTPIVPMLAAAESAGAQWQCVYGGRRRDSMAFVDELGGWGERVRIEPADRAGLLPLDQILATPSGDTVVYCCGPEALLQAVEASCARNGWPAGTLRLERFSPVRHAGDLPNRDFVVELRRSGLSLNVPPDKSILQTLEDAGQFFPSSCGVGTCGTCEVRVLDGTPEHRDSILSPQEREDGTHMMICVSRARSASLVLDL